MLNAALDRGYDHLDTATLYGGGKNETLIGEAISHRRNEYLLASKCGLAIINGKRVIDGRPATLRAQIAQTIELTPAQLSLQWLLTRGDHVVTIPGTTSLDHLAENGATPVGALPDNVMSRLDEVFAPTNAAGHRYPKTSRLSG